MLITTVTEKQSVTAGLYFGASGSLTAGLHAITITDGTAVLKAGYLSATHATLTGNFSAGVVSNKKAKQLSVGGEVLCYVW